MASSVDLLRFITVGDVDDGKSTLIGRLLYDSKSIFDDQLADLRRRSSGEVNLAHLTDGLRSEREQGITIDVAYRFFATPKRKFIVIDAPGHVQYLKNMVTGATHADVGLILVDATRGVQAQTQRHAGILHLMNVRHVVMCVNKMDLLQFSKDEFERVAKACRGLAQDIGMTSVTTVPMSALNGDGVVERSPAMPWYEGPSLLEFLETVDVSSEIDAAELRLPVQAVTHRGIRGRIASGRLRKGDELLVKPRGDSVVVKSISIFPEAIESADAHISVSVEFDRKTAVHRGDILVPKKNSAYVANSISAKICWFGSEPLKTASRWTFRRSVLEVRDAEVELEGGSELRAGEIGRAQLKLDREICFDAYRSLAGTGAGILVDSRTGETCGAVLLQAPATGVFWFTGLSGAGKTTLATRIVESLRDEGLRVQHLDGDEIRKRFPATGFSAEDRNNHVRRVGRMASELEEQGYFVVCSLISPFRESRASVRSFCRNFQEVFISTDIAVCEKRDAKGLYKKARAGEIQNFTGVSDPYEVPLHPDLNLDLGRLSVEQANDIFMKAFRVGRKA